MKSKNKECKCLKCVWGTRIGKKVLCMFWRCINQDKEDEAADYIILNNDDEK